MPRIRMTGARNTVAFPHAGDTGADADHDSGG